VEDNGSGFNMGAPSVRHGNGLENMRKRVENLGGQFEIVSAPQRGTLLRAVLKLKAGSSRAVI
jgi:two-component system NarL family sensor kinase